MSDFNYVVIYRMMKGSNKNFIYKMLSRLRSNVGYAWLISINTEGTCYTKYRMITNPQVFQCQQGKELGR